MNKNTRKLAIMAMLVALSIVLTVLIRVPYPPAPFLEYDPADVPILVGAFAYGPVAGFVLTVVASVIQGFTVSAHSGLYGILMHIIATSTLVVIASYIYRVKHTRVGAVIGLVSGTIAMAVVMMIANHFITPLFMGVPTEQVDSMLIPIILPFNLMKAGFNSIITFIVYKAVSKFIINKEPKLKEAKNTN